MDTLSYTRVGRRGHRARGFRLNSRRFSVYRLRARFLRFIRVLSRWSWKSSCEQALASLRKGSRKNSSNSRKVCHSDCKLRSYGRSNSFYSEAIADCLEFIKQSALTVDDNSVARR